MRRSFSILAFPMLGAWVAACASPPPAPAPTPKESVDSAPPLEAVMWPIAPDLFRKRLEFEDFDIVSAKDVGAGVTGAMRWEVEFDADGMSLPLKWKPAPPGDADGWNNSPRKELAAYRVQTWFLDPEDHIVPLAVMRCLPLDQYEEVQPHPEPNIPGTNCVVGQLSLWIEHVEIPDRLYDEVRFEEEAAYARHMADFNLLGYLIAHRDGRSGNFLVSLDQNDRKVYSIDNGVAFDGYLHNFFVQNWDELRVPALRRASIERLRRLTAEDVDSLGVVAEMRLGPDGVLRNVPPGENLDPSAGGRVAPGTLQLGLKDYEIEALRERLRNLLSRVDRGEIPLL